MGLWKSLGGMLEVELTSAAPECTLDMISTEGIPVFRVKQISDLTVSFQIRRKDHNRLDMLCQRRGETLQIRRRRGVYWPVKRVLTRPMLLAGLVLFLAFALFLPTRVLFVQVEGNASVPENRILEAASDCGIRFGASRREVRSEKMKNSLLSEVPELQWAGVNTYGCVAVISVRERTDVETEKEENRVASITAARDGVILSATATRGNLLCMPGQAVKAGQTLISGYTDCGIVIQATRAEGEVFAQTTRQLTAVTPSKALRRDVQTGNSRKISLILGKKRINLWKDSGIWDSTCGRIYEEYYLTLPGGYQLPVALCVETYTFFETAETEITGTEELLFSFADGYLGKQMVAGEILQRSGAVRPADGIFKLDAAYLCAEMIGRVQLEQIGE